MMQLLRDKAQGVIAWVIIAMIIVVFCFWGVTGYMSSGSAPVIAVVNGKKITTNDIEMQYHRALRYASDEVDLSQIDPYYVKQQILQAMVTQAAITSSLKKDGFWISDTLLLDSVRNNPNLHDAKGTFSPDKYNQLLSSLQMDETEFVQQQKEQLALNQIQAGIISSSFALNSEVERVINIRNQTRSFGYAIIPAASFMNQDVAQQDIDNFYEQNKANFLTPEKIQLEYIELSIADLMSQIKYTDQDLQDYYKQNLSAFSTPQLYRVRHVMVELPADAGSEQLAQAQKRIDLMYDQLQKGANFATLAAEQSDDKSTAVKGGDLGWVSRNDDLPKEVFELQRVNDYSNPVRSDYGLHIFQLTELQGGGAKDFASVKSLVVERYKRDKAEQLFSQKGEELANLTFENPETLLPASEKLGLPIRTTEFFSREGGQGIAAAPNVVKVAFGDQVLEQLHNSDMLRLSDDNYVIIRVKERRLEQQRTLAEEQANIKKYLQKIAAHAAAKQKGETLIGELKQGASPAKLMPGWRAQNDVARDNQKIDRAILQKVFLLPKPTGEQTFSAGGFDLPNGDYVVAMVTKVVDGKFTNQEDSSLLDMVGKQVAMLAGRLEFLSLQNALIEQAKIEYKK